jgi:hypothetical protein
MDSLSGSLTTKQSPPAQAGLSAHVHRTHIFAVAVHILCCGLPLAASAFSLLTGIGGGLARWASDLHHLMHGMEIPLLATSAVLLVIAAISFYVRRNTIGRLDKALFAASLLAFAVNAIVTLPHALSSSELAGLPSFSPLS